VHGGGWQGGAKAGYRFWGPYLNQRGIALYAIDYRLSKPGQPAYPQEVQDVRAAIQFVKSKAADLKADPGTCRPDARFRGRAPGGADGPG
jgi:acetyl esterase/lipase